MNTRRLSVLVSTESIECVTNGECLYVTSFIASRDVRVLSTSRRSIALNQYIVIALRDEMS